jgi:hypothetical protein
MISADPSIEDIITAALHYKAIETRNSLPGRIKSYDPNTNLAEVEVCINPTIRKDGGDEVEVLGVIKNVPIEWMSGGGYFFAFPLQKDDEVKITFHDFSLDQWIEKGGVVTVQDQHTHHLTDASAYPGMRAKPKALPQGHGSKLIIGKIGNEALQFQIDDSFFLFGGAAAEFLARADKVKTEIDKLRSYLTVLHGVITSVVNEPGNGSPSAFQAALIVALTSSGYVPTGIPTISQPAATNVKAE